ncbi:hypothetical protein [Alloscardovia omnicolens]|uniref:hypothetical protein n=1 Tax=Alloscardovia omnicolens TaxID=419015 RepID=UPI003A6F4898
MKKYMYRYLSLVVSFIISVGMISISEKSYAATLGSSGSALTQSVIDRATPHISLDGYVYKLNSHSASQVLTLPEMELVKDQINMTNSAISQAIRDASASKDIVVSAINKKVIFTDCVTSVDPVMPITRAAVRYKEGVSKVEFGWYGLRVYISKTDINHLGGLVLGASVQIPSGIAQVVAAALGFAAGQVPGGIVFESTLPDLVFLSITNIRF